MTNIDLSKPIETTTPVITVPGRALKAGRYRFRLVVVNARGVASEPDEVEVVVGSRSPFGVLPDAAVRGRKRAKAKKDHTAQE